MCTKAIELYRQAFHKMREASLQSHYAHWDRAGTGGTNCPECIRSRSLRAEADNIFDRAQSLAKNIKAAKYGSKSEGRGFDDL